MPQVWTPERRAAQAARMRQRWATGEFADLVAKRRRVPRLWTEVEDGILRRFAGIEPLWRLVELVNERSRYPRGLYAVKWRLEVLGLSAFVDPALGVEHVACGLGRSRVVVCRWIRRGRLHARAGGLLGRPHPRGGVPWIVERAAVDAMLRADPWLIDPADIRDPSWRALVEVERRVAQRRRGRKEEAA